MIRDVVRASIEGMTNMSGSTAGRYEVYKDVIASILSLIVSILIVAFVGKWLWNTSVAELFTFVRPVRTVWQIIGLMLFLALIR
jgi:hypothetical protein